MSRLFKLKAKTVNIKPHKPSKEQKMFYRLDGRKIIPCKNLMDFARYDVLGNNRVGLTEVNGHQVSTIFLGIDHNHTGSGRPILFETMVMFNHEDRDLESLDFLDICKRCCTWDEAVAQHSDIVYSLTVELDIGISSLLKIEPNAIKEVFSGAKPFVDDLISMLKAPKREETPGFSM